MDCIVCGVTKSWTRLSDFHSHFPTEWKETMVSGRLEHVCQPDSPQEDPSPSFLIASRFLTARGNLMFL